MVTWIIDPSSIEENRGSFCYLPYYMAADRFTKSGVDNVRFLEDFRITQKDYLDQIDPDDEILIGLWSYPQIDLCRLLHLRLPFARFFGYSPLIREEELPLYLPSSDEIKTGMMNYARWTPRFKYHLLSDCDGHLKDRAMVYPLATTYGCRRNCSFCPVTPNMPTEDIILSEAVVIDSLKRYQEYQPGSGVHFTDEDFFRNTERAKSILATNKACVTENPGIIALGSVTSFTRFLDSFADDETAFKFCGFTGLYLIEIGMESANKVLAQQMGKPDFQKCVDLAERVKDAPFKILWLSLTLSPGETIQSIADTGAFLEQYGLDPAEMSPRIRTNGTKGGLGQFFQRYPGTRSYEETGDYDMGCPLSDRPTRLVPSYLPASLQRCKVRVVRDVTPEDKEWFTLFGVKPLRYTDGENVGTTLACNTDPMWKSIISVCLAARLGIITQTEE